MAVASPLLSRARCMVFGAGLGSRLGPLTRHLPKPLVPIGNQSVLAHIADKLATLTQESIVVNTFHAAEAYERVQDSRFAYLREKVLLGTAGGLKHAEELLGSGPVLLCNGDMVTDFAPERLLRSAAKSAALATLAVIPLAAGDGNVGVAQDGRVVRLRQTRLAPAESEHRGGWFMGMHLVSSELRQSLPREGCMVSDVYIPLLRKGARIEVILSDRPFVDIGTVHAYVAANWAWLEQSGLGEFVESSARVTGRVGCSIVGVGARVDGDVENAIVWPGTELTGSVRDCIVSPCFRVPIVAAKTA